MGEPTYAFAGSGHKPCRTFSWAGALLVCLTLGRAEAQRYPFRFFSVEDGLVQSGVTHIYQDRAGLLWICTMGGVSRFDGAAFTNFSVVNGFPAEIAFNMLEDREGIYWFGANRGLVRHNGSAFDTFDLVEDIVDHPVRALLEDRSGRFWVGTGKGVYRRDGESFTRVSAEWGSWFVGVTALAEDDEGILWFASGETLARYDGRESTVFRSPRPLGIIHELHSDDRGGIWIGGSLGLARFDGRNFEYFQVGQSPPQTDIIAMTEDSQGRLWLGTAGGLSRYDGESFSHYTVAEGLPTAIVSALLEDREGNLWFGTGGGGLGKFNDAFTIHDSSTGLSSDIVLCFVEDSAGAVWYGTTNGLSRYDGKNYINLHPEDGLAGPIVRDIDIDGEGNLWCATRGGVSKFDGKSFTNYTALGTLNPVGTEAVLIDSQHRIWVGTSLGLCLFREGRLEPPFTAADGLDAKSIWTLFEDSAGRVWAGTKNGAYYLQGNRFHPVPHLEAQIVAAIIEKGDFLWFGIYGGGVVRYRTDFDEVSGQIASFTSEDGLSNDIVYSMIFDDAGSLWVGTNSGLNVIDVDEFNRTKRKIIKTYGKHEGFLGIECNRNSVFKEKNGALWFGTIKGAIRYNPREERINKVEPTTHITGLRVYFEEVDWSQHSPQLTPWGLPLDLTLSYDRNHLTFEFSGISLTVPEKVRYRYKLQGFYDAWSPVTSERNATYSNLPAGDYTFQVKASNNDGVWNREPASFRFTIRPPWWSSWWFRIALTLGMALLLVSVFSFYRGKVRRRAAFDLKQELAFQQKHKMESLGRLAGGIAHDFNNMLASMLGFNALAKMELDSHSLTYQYLNELEKAGERAKELIRQILTFSRQGKPDFRPVSVYKVTKEALKLVQISFPPDIQLKVDLDPQAGWVLGDATQLHQVILNLCTNAKQAVGEGGGVIEVTLTVRTEERVTRAESVRNYAVISVRDSGIGIEPEKLQHLFEPFYTTKEVGEGSGMGLSVAHGIVTAMQGFIRVQTEWGRGSLFEVWLPQSGASETTGEYSVLELDHGNGQHLLFLDDEASLVMATAAILRKLGYKVTGMTDSVEALKKFRQQPFQFDLVITDWRMPRLQGDILGEEMLRIRPDLPLILCTGLSSDFTEEQALAMGFRGYLHKPFTVRDLAHQVQYALQTHEPSPS